MATAHQYTIEALDPGAHLYRVTLTIDKPDPQGQVISIPAWIPGSYTMRDYARHVVAIRAESDGVGVRVSKLDSSHWQATPTDRALMFELDIYAYDDSVRGAHLDGTHAYFNGTCVFPEVAGQEEIACKLKIRRPEIAAARNWRVATSMQRDGAEPYGFGRYKAADYADLIDHPVECGQLAIGEFDVDGVPHAIAIRGNTRVDMARLCRDLETLCRQHMKLLGKPRDLDRYLFLLHAPGTGYGGLEHRWSSSNVCSRDSLPAKGDEGVSSDYRTLLGLLSHEYFHLWNVKRMKPATFSPYDLSRETHTELLWVFEGITSYYDDLALVRSGLISTESYLELVGQAVTRVLRGEGRKRQTVAESSFDAWTKFYKQDANSPNAIVSYYAKGSLIALCLDLRLRADTKGRACLDDVMRECWRRWGESSEGMPEDGFESVCAEVSGLDLGDFFDATVRGTGELPLEPLLASHGVDYNLRAAADRNDKGGKASANGSVPAVWFGANLGPQSGKTVILQVMSGGPAELAGLSPGDELVALDGLRIGPAELDTRQKRYRPRDKSVVTVFRGDELLSVKLRWEQAPATTCYLNLQDDAEDTVGARRTAWLQR